MNRSIWLFSLLPLMLCAVEWRTWDAGKAEARQTGKNLLVALVRTGCHYCHDMERAVFDDPDMSRWIETCFVPVKINLSEARPPFEVRIPMTPTYSILTPEGGMVKTIPGSWNIEDFTDLAQSGCTKE